MAGKSKSKTIVFVRAIIAILLGILVVVKRHYLATTVSILVPTGDGYVFACGMVLILLGILDLSLTPMFMDKNKKD